MTERTPIDYYVRGEARFRGAFVPPEHRGKPSPKTGTASYERLHLFLSGLSRRTYAGVIGHVDRVTLRVEEPGKIYREEETL